LRVLSRIAGPKGEEVTGGWRKLKNEELRNLYSSIYYRMIISSGIRWAMHVVSTGNTRNAYDILVGKSERRRPLGRPRSRSEDNIKKT
jgi:hypothetical protein